MYKAAKSEDQRKRRLAAISSSSSSDDGGDEETTKRNVARAGIPQTIAALTRETHGISSGSSSSSACHMLTMPGDAHGGRCVIPAATMQSLIANGFVIPQQGWPTHIWNDVVPLDMQWEQLFDLLPDGAQKDAIAVSMTRAAEAQRTSRARPPTNRRSFPFTDVFSNSSTHPPRPLAPDLFAYLQIRASTCPFYLLIHPMTCLLTNFPRPPAHAPIRLCAF